MMALCRRGNTKNLLMTASEVKGHLDKETLKLAIESATRNFPQFFEPYQRSKMVKQVLSSVG